MSIKYCSIDSLHTVCTIFAVHHALTTAATKIERRFEKQLHALPTNVVNLPFYCILKISHVHWTDTKNLRKYGLFMVSDD